MNSLLTSNATFAYLKTRWEQMDPQHYQCIDHDLIDILNLINQHPSLVSVMSCASHIDDDRKKRLYIHFAVRDQVGMAVLADLYAYVSDAVLEEHLARRSLSRVVLSDELWPRRVRLSHLHMGVPHLPDETPPEPFYRATTISVSFCQSNHTKWRKKILHVLYKAAENAVNPL